MSQSDSYRRYPSESADDDLAEEVNPESIDTGEKSRWEKFREYLGHNVLRASIAVLIILVIIMILRKFFPGIIYNQWLHGALGVGALIAGTALFTHKSDRDKVQKQVDRLCLLMPDEESGQMNSLVFTGEDEGNVFKVYKGFDWFFAPVEASAEEVASKSNETFAKNTLDDDRPAKIQLDKDYFISKSHTGYGTHIVALCDGISSAPFSGIADFKLDFPEIVSKENFSPLKNLLEEFEEEIIPEKDRRITHYRDKIDELRYELEQREEGAFDRFADQYERIEQAGLEKQEEDDNEVNLNIGGDG